MPALFQRTCSGERLVPAWRVRENDREAGNAIAVHQGQAGNHSKPVGIHPIAPEVVTVQAGTSAGNSQPKPIPAMHMHKSTQAIRDDIEQLAEDASALVAATAGVAGDHVGEARKRLVAGLEHIREFYAVARGKAADGSHAADLAMRDNIYQVVGIGIVAGALVGFLLATRCHCRHE